MDERKSEKKKLFPLAVNRARVNYHSSGERDAQKRSGARGGTKKDKRDREQRIGKEGGTNERQGGGEGGIRPISLMASQRHRS